MTLVWVRGAVRTKRPLVLTDMTGPQKLEGRPSVLTVGGVFCRRRSVSSAVQHGLGVVNYRPRSTADDAAGLGPGFLVTGKLLPQRFLARTRQHQLTVASPPPAAGFSPNVIGNRSQPITTAAPVAPVSRPLPFLRRLVLPCWGEERGGALN